MLTNGIYWLLYKKEKYYKYDYIITNVAFISIYGVWIFYIDDK